MDCKCMQVDPRFWIVDPKCIPLMHQTPKRRYSEGGDMAVPEGSMFDLNIFVESANGAALIFDCGCEAHFHPDGEPFFDIDTRCLLEHHPDLCSTSA